jgi:hypothetical protein
MATFAERVQTSKYIIPIYCDTQSKQTESIAGERKAASSAVALDAGKAGSLVGNESSPEGKNRYGNAFCDRNMAKGMVTLS